MLPASPCALLHGAGASQRTRPFHPRLVALGSLSPALATHPWRGHALHRSLLPTPWRDPLSVTFPLFNPGLGGLLRTLALHPCQRLPSAPDYGTARRPSARALCRHPGAIPLCRIRRLLERHGGFATHPCVAPQPKITPTQCASLSHVAALCQHPGSIPIPIPSRIRANAMLHHKPQRLSFTKSVLLPPKHCTLSVHSLVQSAVIRHPPRLSHGDLSPHSPSAHNPPALARPHPTPSHTSLLPPTYWREAPLPTRCAAQCVAASPATRPRGGVRGQSYSLPNSILCLMQRGECVAMSQTKTGAAAREGRRGQAAMRARPPAFPGPRRVPPGLLNGGECALDTDSCNARARGRAQPARGQYKGVERERGGRGGSVRAQRPSPAHHICRCCSCCCICCCCCCSA